MSSRKLRLLGGALTVAIFIIAFSDPSNAGIHFLAKLTILVIGVTVPLSLLIRRFFGPEGCRKFWGNLVLIGVSVSIALLSAEFVTRFAFPDVSTTADGSSYFSQRWYRLHPPQHNELGFREGDVSSFKSPEAYRIAIIGDSFTYGQGILAEERFSNLLQRELDQSTGHYEVLNFGRPGAETDDHLRILNEIVLGLSPDFLLLQWFVNDVEVSESGRATSIRLIPSDFVRSWLHTHSAVYYLVNSQWNSLQGALGLTETYIDNMTRRFTDPNSEESLAASAAVEQLIERLREQNIAPGIVLFPMMFDVHGDVDGYPLGFLMDRVLVFCDQQGVPCLDLRPVFAAELSTPDLWANRLDHHPGAEANKLASKAILTHFGRIWGTQ